MQPNSDTAEDRLVTEFIERMNRAGDGPAARDVYRAGFDRLRSTFDLYPASGRDPSAIFESAGRTARTLAAGCLPLGIAVNVLSQLRAHALRLLDDVSSGSDLRPLQKTTSAMKLRVSLMAQATMALLRSRAVQASAAAEQLRADASELGYIKSQPTADEIILRSIGAA